MCGLFGMAGPGVLASDLEFLRQLAYVSGLRGFDGAGILQGGIFKKHWTWKVKKTASDISYFLWFHSCHKDGDKDILDKASDNMFIGHVRAATRGAISDSNSHPFETSRFIGVHNGTLRDTRFQHATKTDSELLFEEMDTKGINKTLGSLDKDSAYAVVVFDKNERTITIARNAHRPLFVGVNSQRGVIYWASEKWMLETLADRCGIKIGKIWIPSEGLMHTFRPMDIQTNNPAWTINKIESFVEAEKKEEEKPVLLLSPPEKEEARSNIVQYPLIKSTKPKLLSSKNTERLEIISKKNSLTGKRFVVDCDYCSLEMDLFERFQGNQYEPGHYVCKECAPTVEKISNKVSVH